MIAPAFQSYLILSKSPFMKETKLYITVLNQKTKTKRDVRYYNDSEYAKMYGTKISSPTPDFSKGPILVVRNYKLEDEEYLRKAQTQYFIGAGYYFTSGQILPADAPPHFRYLLLSWKEINQILDKPSKIAKLLDNKANEGKWIKFIQS